MATLDARARAKLPDSAFAYVDSHGRRRLPIHDEAHVRNALARFDRVDFEDEAARDRARMRLLRATRKHGIVALGFVGAQLRPERALPRGQVTFLMADIEGSTELLHRLGDGYGPLLGQVRRVIRSEVRRAGGREIDARGDELFAAFAQARAALVAGVAIQQRMRAHGWPAAVDPRVRVGIHSGRPTLGADGYVGISVHTVARICTAAHGGQIVVSSAARDAVGSRLPEDVSLTLMGTWRFKGLRDPVELLQVRAGTLPSVFPPPRAARPAGSR